LGRVHVESVWVDYRPVRGQRRRAKRIWALQDVSLTLEPGERLGVLGGNGSGKTTLLRTISGVFEPSTGRASITGRVGSVIDLTPGPQRDLSGHENLRIEAALLGLEGSELRRRYGSITELAALPPGALEQPIYTYSSGMLLRLQLALAICSDPDILVIDEVLAVADARFQDRYLERIAALREKGTVLVLASHNLDVIAAHTDRAVAMDAGRVGLSGPSRTVVDRYERALAHAFASTATGGDAGSPGVQGARAPLG
jgi:lipopolysaccharide transport system ATP-binding protein